MAGDNGNSRPGATGSSRPGITWGPRHEWTTTAKDGTPVSLSLCLPEGWETSEVLADVGRAAANSPAARMREVAKLPGSFPAQRLRWEVSVPGEPKAAVIVTFTALLADRSMALPASPPPGTRDAELTQYSGTVAQELRTVPAQGSRPEMSVLILTYILRTPFGPLSASFASPQVALHDAVEPLIQEIADTIRLDLAMAG